MKNKNYTNLLNIYIIIIIIIYTLLINANSISVTINDENDLIDSFKINSRDTLILNIYDNNITIFNDILINEDNNFKKISINGLSKELSILNFNSNDIGFIFDNKNVEEINFKNLTIYGQLEFKNYNNTINIENLNFKGNIDFVNQSPNKVSIKLNNFHYYGNGKRRKNCIDLRGNVIIDNSFFYGSISCKESILSYNGNNENYIKITNSYFDGVYVNNCIHIENSNKSDIDSSIFNRGKSNENGGAIQVNESNVYIDNCKFNDNFSMQNGGVLYVINSYSFQAQNIETYNATALQKGSFLYMYSSPNFKTKGYILNTKQYNTNNINMGRIESGGLIASVEGYSRLYIENFYGENLNGGGAFTLNSGSSIEINNIELKKIYSSNLGGVLLTSIYEENDSFFKVNNGVFSDFYQNFNGLSSSFIWITKNMRVLIENCFIKDLYLNMGNEGPSIVELNNVSLIGHYSIHITDLIKCHSDTKSGICKLTLNNVHIEDFQSMNGILNVNNGNINIYNSTFSNFEICIYSSFCDIDTYNYYEKDGYIAYLGSGTYLTINNSEFINIFGRIGFKAEKNTYITINDSEISFNSFFYGLIPFDTSDESAYNYGHYIINNTYFSFNSSNNGGIVNIKEIDKNSSIIFNNSTFYYNIASYGGIIYSTSKLTPKYVSFYNCEFIGNFATYEGDISYCLMKIYEPYFSNIDEIRKMDRAFSTNPVGIRLKDDSIKYFSMLSGDVIPYGIKGELFNDYGNTVKFVNLDIFDYGYYSNYVIFHVYNEDNSDVAIIGHTLSYCTAYGCDFPLFKIVGNPGTYKLIAKIDYYGSFMEFKNNTFEFKFTINKCDEKIYRYNDIENLGFKSCYEPICIPSCNSGICVNNNICDCTNTPYKGLLCNEYYQLERNKILDIGIKVIAITLTFVSLIFIIGILLFKHNIFLKTASIDFLIIILIGIILNCYYIITLTYEYKSKKICLLSYLTNNMGFTLIYGSIAVKTYRIYAIFSFSFSKKINTVLKKEKMYITLFIMGMVHIILLYIWSLSHHTISSVNYTNDFKEYSICSFPKSIALGTTFNIIILFIGWTLDYANRNLKNEYKENMTVPTYVYILTTLFMEIVKSNTGINIIVQDFLNAIGSIIQIVVIMYYVYITKFKKLFFFANRTLKKLNRKSEPKRIYINKLTVDIIGSNTYSRD